MKEIYIRAKAVNGTYVYIPKGTENTYGTVLIDNDTLKYYNDSNGNTKLRVKGAALVDNNSITGYQLGIQMGGGRDNIITNNTMTFNSCMTIYIFAIYFNIWINIIYSFLKLIL